MLDGLDTLYATLPYAAVDDAARARLEALEAAEATGPPLLHRADPLQAWIKLRPGLAAFLDALAQRCELWLAGSGGEALLRVVGGEGRAIPSNRVCLANGMLPEVWRHRGLI